MKEQKENSAALFAPDDRVAVDAFLAKVRERLNLSRKHEELMLEDHLAALRYYRREGIGLIQAMERLNPEQLGDFYRTERTDWYPLDHAAKIYPLSMGSYRMAVFRMSGYLKEPIVPEILQMALSYTIRRFPYFATTVKSGFFWHYLDSSMRRYALKPETKLPCSVMRVSGGASPALRVIYYENRVSVEFFHILADGTGAGIFLRTLLREYLRLMGHDISLSPGIFSMAEYPNPKEWQDDFTIGDKGAGAHGFADKRALPLKGRPAYESPNRVLHYNLSVRALSAKAKEKGVTITALMLGYLMLACREAAVKEKGTRRGGGRKLQIQLPVNMRKYYPSETLRNFSMYCSIRLSPDEIGTLEDILPGIAEQMKEGTSKERLDETMHLSRRLVRWLRFVPLAVKRPIAYLIYGTLSDSVFTTVLSNLGVMGLPEEMAQFVEKFDVLMAPSATSRACCAMCSFGDRAVFTITKNTPLTLLEDAFYRLLCEDGLDPYMEGTD